MKLSEKISAKKAAIVDLKDRLAVLMDNEELDEQRAAEAEELSAQIEIETRALEVLERAEQSLATRATVATPQSIAQPQQRSHVIALTPREPVKGDLLFKALTAQLYAHKEHRSLPDVLNAIYPGNTELEAFMKAASKPADSVTVGWAAELVGQTIADFMRDLHERALRVLESASRVRDGAPGARGKRGPQGPAGTLAQARPWTVGEIYKAGEFVWLPATHPLGWAMAHALADTYEIPGDEGTPWEPVVFHGEPGAPGQGMQFAGAWERGKEYAAGDVVIGAGGDAWVRKSPGASDTLPGDGWAVLTKRGGKGGRGKPGEPGPRGPAGVGIEDLSIAGDELVVLLTNGDVRTLPLPMVVVRVPR